MFVLDTSTSVSSEFGTSAAIEETLNFVRRTLNNVNVHPQATRWERVWLTVHSTDLYYSVAMISYAAHPRVEFDFKSPKSRNNSAIMNYLQDFHATAVR